MVLTIDMVNRWESKTIGTQYTGVFDPAPDYQGADVPNHCITGTVVRVVAIFLTNGLMEHSYFASDLTAQERDYFWKKSWRNRRPFPQPLGAIIEVKDCSGSHDVDYSTMRYMCVPRYEIEDDVFGCPNGFVDLGGNC